MLSDIPNVTVSPLLQFVNMSGLQVTIMCSVLTFSEAIAVGWRKVSLDGQTNTTVAALDNDDKYAIVQSWKSPDLTINNVDFDDDANYRCFATNAIGTGISNNARIDVISSK